MSSVARHKLPPQPPQSEVTGSLQILTDQVRTGSQSLATLTTEMRSFETRIGQEPTGPHVCSERYRTVYILRYKDIWFCCSRWIRTKNSCSQRCPPNTRGRGCNFTCNCVLANTYCDHICGCSCRPGWTAPDCSVSSDTGSRSTGCTVSQWSIL
ncbi:protein draper-like [Acanthaster planci]|uniref:Protein draper-like n=1 Tax=Acanthaster planci TaxID=133434 RepID=A0A8B7Z2Y5_ACAPL|nr:protein draper-like [Acanthaster planci]